MFICHFSETFLCFFWTDIDIHRRDSPVSQLGSCYRHLIGKYLVFWCKPGCSSSIIWSYHLMLHSLVSLEFHLLISSPSCDFILFNILFILSDVQCCCIVFRTTLLTTTMLLWCNIHMASVDKCLRASGYLGFPDALCHIILAIASCEKFAKMNRFTNIFKFSRHAPLDPQTLICWWGEPSIMLHTTMIPQPDNCLRAIKYAVMPLQCYDSF